LGVPDDPYCSPEVVHALIEGRSALLKDVKTVNDVILLLIGWVYDLNYTRSMKLVLERDYIGQLEAFLPSARAVRSAVSTALSYVRDGAAESGGEPPVGQSTT